MIFAQAFLISFTIIQCLFYLYLKSGWRKSPTCYHPKKTAPVSIVVAAHNEAHHLPKLLSALLAQEYPVFEIVLVLDRCTDNSLEVLKAFQDAPHLLVIEIDETSAGFSGKKYALHKGIEAAKYELLAFTDADCVPRSNQWLKHVSTAFGPDTAIAIGYSPYQRFPGLLNRLIRYETITVALQYFSMAQLGHPYMGVGRNMAYRKTFYTTKRGFGQFSATTGGDDDLFISHHATSSNINSYYSVDSFVDTIPKQTWRSWFKQKQRHLSVGKHYRKSHQLILSLLSASQIGFWLTFVILAAVEAVLLSLVLCYLCRIICLMLFFGKGLRKLGDNFEWWWIPVLDVIYTTYLMTIGPVGYFTKRVKWS